MRNENKNDLREFIKKILTDQGDDNVSFSDEDLLISSGRIDSLNTLTIISFLEKNFSIDFSNVDFDVDYIDSIEKIVLFIDQLQLKLIE